MDCNLLCAVLDECTSQVSFEMEQKLYSAAQAANITCISVGHRRQSLAAFHQLELQLLPVRRSAHPKEHSHSGDSMAAPSAIPAQSTMGPQLDMPAQATLGPQLDMPSQATLGPQLDMPAPAAIPAQPRVMEVELGMDAPKVGSSVPPGERPAKEATSGAQEPPTVSPPMEANWMLVSLHK